MVATRFVLALALTLLAAPTRASDILEFLQAADPLDAHAIGGVAVSPDGKHVYGFDIDGFVYLFDRSATDGTLTVVDRYIYDPNGYAHRSCEYAHGGISPDGKHVYMTCYGSDDERAANDFALSVFSRDATTGVLTPVEGHGSFENDLEAPWHIAFSPDGLRLYVACHGGSMSVWDRDAGTGALTAVSSTPNPNFARYAGVAVSPDGLHVYATTEYSFLDAFDATPGGLSLITSYEEGVDGYTGIDGGVQAVMSQDGKFLYVAASYLGAVGVFSRDATTGDLTFVQSDDAGSGGSDIHQGVAITPDGRFILNSNSANTELRLYARDASTGMVTLLVTDDHLDFGDPYIVVSPDGRNAYVATRGGPYVYQLNPDGCRATPAAGCVPSAVGRKSSLLVKDDPNDAKDSVIFKFKGPVTPGELGDPLTTTGYAICVYDESGPGGDAQLLGEAFVPPGGICRTRPCWKATPTGFGFTDALRVNAGANKLTLKSGGSLGGTIVAKVGGLNMTAVSPPLVGTVRAQVKNAEGACFEATFTAPDVNVSGLFRAKSD
jgi:DNA-binding beta-propeller fold protein YncE